jgi:hypothetical protein
VEIPKNYFSIKNKKITTTWQTLDILWVCAGQQAVERRKKQQTDTCPCLLLTINTAGRLFIEPCF